MTAAAIPTGPDELAWDLTAPLDLATAAVADGRLPCIAFGVIDRDGAQQTFALGRPGRTIHEDSVFFIASVTKAIVATALMRYVEEGRLDLSAPLGRYVAGFDGQGREHITAWHLLTHTSGLPDMPIARMRRERPRYADLLTQTMASRPSWPPGTRYEYNSSAWCLLGETMARLSNVAWPDVLHDRLLGPLQMDDTVFDARPRRDRIIAVEGLEIRNRLVAEVLLWFLARAAFPGGGLFGTVPDLLRLGWALLGQRILSAATVARMAELQTGGIPYVAADGSVSYVRQGLGWRKSGDGWPMGEAVLTHGGQAGSRLWVDPERGFAFAFLTNVWDVSSDTAAAVLGEVYRAIP